MAKKLKYDNSDEVVVKYAQKDSHGVDIDVNAKQNTLVSGENIKTINGNSLLGSGDITISGGGGTWGSITGTLSNQTDLNTELTNIRAVAEGKCKTWVLKYDMNFSTGLPPSAPWFLVNSDGTTTNITSQIGTAPYIDGNCNNILFNNDIDEYVSIDTSKYYIFMIKGGSPTQGGYVVKGDVISSVMKSGDVVLITNTNVPDRWFNGVGAFWKLETTKVSYTGGTGIDITGTTIKAIGVEYKDNATVQSNALKFVKLTQTQYDAIATKDTNTFYIIIG